MNESAKDRLVTWSVGVLRVADSHSKAFDRALDRADLLAAMLALPHDELVKATLHVQANGLGRT